MDCPDCGSYVKYLQFEAYCSGCGLVIDDEPVDDSAVIESDGDGNLSTGTGPGFTWLDPLWGTYSLIGTKSERYKWNKKRRTKKNSFTFSGDSSNLD